MFACSPHPPRMSATRVLLGRAFRPTIDHALKVSSNSMKYFFITIPQDNLLCEANSNSAKGVINPKIPNMARSFPMFELNNQVFVVTGGAGGRGIAIVEAIAQAGGIVHVLDRIAVPQNEFFAAKTRITKEFGDVVFYHQVDSTNEQQQDEVIGAIADKHKRLDGLVAAAATQRTKPALEWSHEEVMEMLEVNVAGARLSAVSCAKQMVKYNCPGSIVIVASMSAFIANEGLECHIYNGSKAGVVGMGRVLAMEWAGGLPIRVNFLCPGNIITPMVLKNFADDPTLRVKWEKANMLGRISIPEEYKGAIIYMLSQASSFMTGAPLVIDGGHTAK